MAKIVVIGAGVVGLTSALQLARKGHKVTIIAKELPGDFSDFYTSPYAGAFFIHIASLKNPEFLDELQDISSYYEFLEIAEKDPTSGVTQRETNVYIPRMSMHEENYEGPWFKDLVRDYAIIPVEEYPDGAAQDDIVFAFKYTGFIINPVQYLHYLLSQCIKHGVNYMRRTLTDISSAKEFFIEPTKLTSYGPAFGANIESPKNNVNFSSADLVVNCTGLMGPELNSKDADNNLPIKGQTLLVENSAEKIIVVEPMDKDFPTESLYILPRKGYGTLLTGTYLYNDKSLNFDPLLTERIKERSLRYAPELTNSLFMRNCTDLTEVKQFIGIRPGRKGGVNLTRDIENGVDIVHNYGSGHSGYQNSYGLAHKVLQLVDEIVTEKKLTYKL
ncbi:hypothetical protein CANARDRAFT_6169 [[Candida] arabinofermentans NRRL YB-2248]|uniref:FAD dependent oxidoreductase domain-containing protein n=1 Tax=[Candida] arabinofermentans NRRL YB-2248 TaxID=983967 RepID=A0A1E4T486_9ASCO|nr:hypothetical protein CANARDRAFT_6169 [[Candida] arabinofermentans NRRL YB-2248]